MARSAARDRVLAAQLYERGVPVCAVENAFVLAARRLIRPADAQPLITVGRSLASAGDRGSAPTGLLAESQ